MRTMIRSILTLGLVLLSTGFPLLPASAQGDDLQIRITQVDNSRFPQVTVYISVTNAAGEPVGIDPSTIQVFENGRPMQAVQIRGGGQGEVGRLTTMLVMDVSGSMEKNGKLDGAKAAARAYVEQMRPGDQAGLMAYNTQVSYVQPLTAEPGALIQAINALKPSGNTAMFDALIQAEEALKDVAGRKAIIVLTDGLDNRSRHKAQDVIAGIGPSGLSISTIGLGDPTTSAQSGLDEAVLRSLAQQAGGVYSFASDPQALRALYQLYGRALQSEYAITYISPSTLRDGINRTLSVSLGDRAVSAQGKYNPGGVLPEVSQRSWGLFGGLLAGLLALLIAPLLVSRGRQVFGAHPAGRKGRVRLKAAPPAPPHKGRVRLK